jgi:quercetin 2,3-dioxygenase
VTTAGEVRVQRSADRFVTVGNGVRTSHLLSFGDHYDPSRTTIGPVIAHNDEIVDPGAGYALHRHRGIEIVTWVVAGRLAHRDSAGEGVLGPGSAQLLGAGSGVDHEETAAIADGRVTSPTRFIQMWLAADRPDSEPRYASAQFDAAALRSQLVPVAAGAEVDVDPAVPKPLRLDVRGASCLVGRLAPGDERRLPATDGSHLFVVSGAVDIAGGSEDLGRLDAGDSAVLSDLPGSVCRAHDEAEIVVWCWSRRSERS